ncbi:MAG: outer membrane protein assembly factor BamA [Bacteroidota bacterium]|nr:MAG: outer membrane protein assembly factor BamA [Bacteroidota bacterium]
MLRFIYLLSLCFFGIAIFAQEEPGANLKIFDYSRPTEYVIAEIKVTGVQYLNPNHLIGISGLQRGQKITIPGTEIQDAINKYWRHGLFSDVQVYITKIEGENAFIEIKLVEQPRLNNLKITGLNKSETDDIKEKINLNRGVQLTDNVINNAVTIIKKHFVKKGYFNIEVKPRQVPDTTGDNRVNLWLEIEKKSKVKIDEIIFEGNDIFTTEKLRKAFKKTKQKSANVFKSTKYSEEDYKADKILLIDFYNESGYRDAKIVKEELITLSDKRIALKITIYEGSQYYIRSIRWIGNTIYPSELLSQALGVKEKQVYDKKLINDRLSVDEDAVSNLYLDNGYLFFTVTPYEVRIDNDSVDLEFRIREGEPANINKIIIKGNTKTNEHVIRRELYTRPGELFSKTDLIRSYREIANLGHFNPENIGLNPLPNPADGTVDIEYNLEERANDQLELSGGWGGGYGFVGSIGVRFTNMALDRALNFDEWRPVPTGNGQTLSLRAQSNLYYHGFNISFIEPWLGGRKPNSLSISFNYTIQKTQGSSVNQVAAGSFKTLGGSVGFGKRLKWPDDYFSVYTEFAYNLYRLKNYPYFALGDGDYNMLTIKGVLSRSSQDQMIYPRQGSSFSLGLEMTPPYSAFNGVDYANDSTISSYERYRNVEFHKWTFNAAWYTSIVGNLVLALKAEFGALGFYNEDLGYPIFEKFDMGGSGLSGYNLYGTDVVPLRGYEDNSLTPRKYDENSRTYIDNGNIYSRFYAELRYPITLNPSATLYGHVFIEGGNIWQQWDEVNPYSVKRAAGLGIRAFLPMFGLLGFDWAFGFDPIFDSSNGNVLYEPSGQFHFIIGQQL